MKSFSFSLLAIGNMGDAARISLSSLIKLKPFRICIMSDQSGKDWVSDIASKLEYSNVCWHAIPEALGYELGISFERNRFRSFGEEDFVRITPLKWLLLESALNSHIDINCTLFSDLDILWLKIPQISSYDVKDNFIYAQKDFLRYSGKKHFCTGIMLWQRTDANITQLRNIFRYHASKIEAGELIPDEPIFNTFFDVASSEVVQPLEANQYVIGHRIFEVLYSPKFDKLQMIAFHANYLYGDNSKSQALLAINALVSGSKAFIYHSIRIFFSKLRKRIRIRRD